MKLAIQIFVILIASTVAIGQWTEHTTYFNGKKYIYKLTAETLKDTKSWEPEIESSGLLTPDLVKFARRGLLHLVPSAGGGWIVEYIGLNQVGWGARKWYYQISFRCDEKGAKHYSDRFSVFLRLDGTQIQPRILEDNEPPNEKKGEIRIAKPKTH